MPAASATSTWRKLGRATRDPAARRIALANLRTRAKLALHRLGLPIELQQAPIYAPSDRAILTAVSGRTMTSAARIIAVCDAARYVSRNGVEGAVVECGVWRGGSMMAAALALIGEDDAERDLYLYDTFSGMTEPTPDDVDFRGQPAAELFSYYGRNGRAATEWCSASAEEVRLNLASTGYPAERCHLVAGRVEETIPATVPERIALLRLDTDWYESTRHELEHLVPLVSPGGVLIIDDYGHWSGARRAVDEYFARRGYMPLLHRTDYSGRVCILPAGVGAVAPS